MTDPHQQARDDISREAEYMDEMVKAAIEGRDANVPLDVRGQFYESTGPRMLVPDPEYQYGFDVYN